MPKTTYRYTGPNSAVTLKVPTSEGGTVDQDVILWSGQNVELPSDHEVTKALEHQGLLEPVSQAQAEQADKSTTTKAK
jgi:hypothetical protein